MKQELEHFYIGNSYGGNQDWFLINGYDESENGCKVKAVTCGSSEWLELRELWNTGHERRGGFILYHID